MSTQSEFDYVIVGGGTAGLVLASRLTEDPSVTVLVLEAGEPNITQPEIMVPGQFGMTFGNPKFDWAFTTVKQKFSNDREVIWSRGKGLGGSSALNFYAWIKPPAADIDAIEKLGNPGWNWAEYMTYTKKSETFHPPTELQPDALPQTWDASLRGTDGPIHTTIPFHYHVVDDLFQGTMKNMGVQRVEDPYGGNITGMWLGNSNLDPKDWTRSYATTGYYLPAQDRPNLTVLTESTVARILFKEKDGEKPLTASGVEYLRDGDKSTVNAKREVMLCAGAIKSPQILELSGKSASAENSIGRPGILSTIGVETKIELPGVGENVQEHSFFGISYELAGSPPTLDSLHDPAYAAEAKKLYQQGLGPQRAGVTSFSFLPLSFISPAEAPALIDALASNLEKQIQAGSVPQSLKEQWELQMGVLKDDCLPDVELAAFPGHLTLCPGKTYCTVMPVLTHPFSRGTIHATSSDPTANPAIDPHYFENDFDLEVLVQAVKYTRKLAQTEPFKSGVVREVDPGVECVTDEQIREYIKNVHGTTWHTVGSCSMLPRSKNGVVDPELKVYGTTNLRVVDLSVVPLHIAAHTQATVYVIAEKAADIIRGRQ
ncbi:GMC oxidoreductase [Roridomyces roridus]|uniref:GMC oxidoreductase n=1 Tax=Roridomyces roridus TaxID=1738132 RepID=A0AAD7C044_9AGAR|nr:GMC oxidoreductase [Roridomyces roridus]